jgi:SAM-dependent methyltransferase
MLSAATDVWRPKAGVHPALAWIRPYLADSRARVLDIGASNGDLLAQLKPLAHSVSALDVAVFPHCQSLVDGEYIVGEVDGAFDWSNRPYDVVTAFDVFEHFLDAGQAVENIASLVSIGGKLIVETGDWKFNERDLGKWYYANLFEHQIFWSRQAFDHLCGRLGFAIADYRRVNHKGRRALNIGRRLALFVMVALAPIGLVRRATLAVAGRDPSLFTWPFTRDHAFVVLDRVASQ